MSVILTQPLVGPAAWKGPDLTDTRAWTTQLAAPEIAVIDQALAHLKSRGKAYPHFGRDDFPLAALAPLLARVSEELENGRGFWLMRGLPVERYSDDEINTIYYGLGLHMGIPVRQNPRGDLLGEVMAVGDINDKNTRVYQTNLYLPYHSDPSDVVGLLCLRKARRGGLSSLVSVATIYNTILATRPELLGLYYRPWYYAHLCEDLPSLSPLFSYHQGKLSCRYLRQYIELGHEIRQLPLSPVEIEALDVFDAVMQSPDIRLDMMLEPGDLQFANNYAVLHSRTDFEDHPEQHLRRRMLRLWLKMPNARQLAPEFPGRNGFPAPEEAVA
ncbi:TauD/TfdA family dioxygenase [Ottowia sp.]|uniref:TauD/TfdA family dioxygenase n=1 Tax=Ottowia sp. TaxID=1898956 RepID=UPI002BF373BA|nr:TauD/TfdA family dioxygenase [Ottowia sp.]HOB66158.1 TauD/TfdA family dioxygenase [Ottowia sp.]HPZ57392.1 TauD/TfdA family dioxygenase [Ottowia sp.]HQD47171.1 TauD/TfdA family dioxygenase [Ottowia sp.]